ncbi:MAG: GTP pyrophosphokinase family protein [Coriobacteriia bacterium]|nr:GTP pyrophosphokinase family protein [Coriobacteriia bacterium]
MESISVTADSGESITISPENMGDMVAFMSRYACAIMEVETKFNVLNAQFNASKSYNPIDTIKTRLKTPESIVEKLRRRGLPLTTQAAEDNLTDVAGVRVICPFVEDIYLLADYLLMQDDVELLEKKDYIAKPKGNGYRSLHLIVQTPVFTPQGKTLVKVEIQLRTIAMEFWANLEHRLRYKKGLDPELLEDLGGELRECADICESLDQRMGGIRRKIEATTTLLDAADKEWQ